MHRYQGDSIDSRASKLESLHLNTVHDLAGLLGLSNLESKLADMHACIIRVSQSQMRPEG